jgi:hypothetical protein
MLDPLCFSARMAYVLMCYTALTISVGAQFIVPIIILRGSRPRLPGPMHKKGQAGRPAAHGDALYRFQP